LETAMTTVVVAEKPSVARDIARVLGARRKAEGHLEGNGYCVTWALGHLVHFAEDMVPQLPGILEKLDHPQAPLALERLRDGHKLGKAYVDQTKLTDHHAILPTGKAPPPSLPPTLRKIYDLIVDRFVGVFLPDQVVEETVMTLDIAGATFVAKGTRVLKAGWKWIEQGKAKEQGAAIEGGKGGDGRQALPTLEEGQTVHVKVMDVVEKETQPPKPYTDATLLAAMKHAGREIEDDALAEAMKQTGLGTPATRAEIIEKLIRTAYVQRERKQLRATEKGRALIALVAEPLRRHGSAEQTPISTAARTASEPLTCPKCGQGRIIEGKRGFGCNRFREGCDFVVWKEIGGKRLTEKQVHALIGKGKTGLLKGFKSKSGKKFDARLRLNPQWRVAFEFPQRNQGSIDSKKP
jgi:DNA topoisomerase IA